MSAAGRCLEPGLSLWVLWEGGNGVKSVLELRARGSVPVFFPPPHPVAAVWNRIIEPVAMMRKEADMLRLFPEYLKGEELFGLTVHAVLRIAESVGPGVGW